MNFNHISFSALIDTTMQVISSPASILVLATVAHLITRRAYFISPQAIDSYVEVRIAEIEASQAASDTNDTLQDDTSQVPEMEEKQAQAARKLIPGDTYIDGYNTMSAAEKKTVIDSLKNGEARLGKSKLGSYIFNYNTGRVMI